ncbi:MAG: MBOAT family O-acyltransferase [Oscillospiraceae bacterium]
MLFSSVSFLYWFLPLAILVYFLIPKKGRNSVLLLFSLFFYFYGEPKYLFLMVGSTLSTYLFGLWIDKAKRKRLPLILSLSLSIGLLLFFKYADFFIQNTNAILGSDLALLQLVLPIGISFYTFQEMSYSIDLYRGNAKVQKNFISFACYVTLFPQLIAGPIVRYTVIEEQLKNRSHSLENFSKGAFRFVIGLSKKVLIANVLGEFTEKFAGSGEKSLVFFWVSAIAYTLHVYFDFSGYSDMAIGLGRIFGFTFLENFNYPLIAKSIGEFWRRWHISLGSWFRDYVYIPLGGSRVSTLKWLRNILVVWFLTGFWHGAAWNFVLWGLYFAVFLLLEKLFLGKLLQKLPALFSHLYVLFFIVISFVLFNSPTLDAFGESLAGMFGGAPILTAETLYYLKSYGVILILAAVGATPLLKILVTKISEKKGGQKVLNVLAPVVMTVGLITVTAFLIDGSFNPFLYFRF